jgi:hypothetical protein
LYLALYSWLERHEMTQIDEQALQQAIWPNSYPSAHRLKICAYRAC